MEIKQVHEQEEKGITNPAVARLMAEARDKIYEAIAIQSGDPVEEVRKFFTAVEKANKEARAEKSKEYAPVNRQHTLFTNFIGNDDLVGVCIIIGYQKKDSDTEKIMPIKYMTSRLIEPLGVDVLTSAAVSYEDKNKVEGKTLEPLSKADAETVTKQVTTAVDAIEAIGKGVIREDDTALEEPIQEDSVTVETEEKTEIIPF